VVVAFVMALAGATYVLYVEHRRTVDAGVQARAFDLARDRALAAVTDVRISLQAVLVPGQGEDYWLPRATAALETAKGELGTLRQTTLDGSALNDLEAAAAALDDASTVRAEVARYLAGDMRTQAARVMFADGVEALTAAVERIESARSIVKAQRDTDLLAAESLQAMVGAGLVAAALIVVGLLLPTGDRVTTPAAQAQEPAAIPNELPPAAAGSRADEGTPTAAPPAAPAAPAPETRARDLAPAAEHVPEAGAMLPQRDRRKAPELRAAADLCTDFARLVDGQEMPALLERAARLLDSTGFIVWLADADGRQLRPSLAHGYPQQMLAKVPTIARNADNATAAAFRHSEMQVVRTNGMSPGAIVVPILGPNGCVGVMAAEVRHGREASESARALARIVAAQLATLIGATGAQTATEASPSQEAVQQVG
jgi:hypothetical protein